MIPSTVLLTNALLHLVQSFCPSPVSVAPFCLIPFLNSSIFLSTIRKKYSSHPGILSSFSLQSPPNHTLHWNLYFSLLRADTFCHDFEVKLKSFSWTSDPNYQLMTRYIYLHVSRALLLEPISTFSSLLFPYSFSTGQKYYSSLS